MSGAYSGMGDMSQWNKRAKRARKICDLHGEDLDLYSAVILLQAKLEAATLNKFHNRLIEITLITIASIGLFLAGCLTVLMK